MIDKINIRVYAIYINENQEIMALDEGYAGQKLIKITWWWFRIWQKEP